MMDNARFVKVMDMDGGKCLAIDASEALKLKPVDAEGELFIDEGKYRWVIVPECGPVKEVDARTAAEIITDASHSVPFCCMAIMAMATDYISDDDKIIAVFDLMDGESGIGALSVYDDDDFGPGVWTGWMQFRNTESNAIMRERVAVAHPITRDGKKLHVLRGYNLHAVAKAIGLLRDLRFLCEEEN